VSRVIVTLDLSDEIYDLARGRAESEFVSTETWIGYAFERSVNLERRRAAEQRDSAQKDNGESGPTAG
jgi:hypothetical protein